MASTATAFVSDATSQAALQGPAGFGTSPFGSSPFGGWAPIMTATILGTPGTATLLPATATAALASNGTGTAALTASAATAVIQLV